MCFLMDGSKLEMKVGVTVYHKKLSVKLNFRLPDYYILFQAEVAAIKVAVAVLLRSAVSASEVSVHSDSRAAILTLSSMTVCSRFFKELFSSFDFQTSLGACPKRNCWKLQSSLVAPTLLYLHRSGNELCCVFLDCTYEHRISIALA